MLHKKISYALLILLLCVFVVSPFFSHVVWAQDSTGAPDATEAASGGLVSGAITFNCYVIDPVCAVGRGLNAVATMFFKFGGVLTEAAGSMLDRSIKFSTDTSKLKFDGIQKGWEVFRDLANMAFIFILLYIALATILQVSNLNTKRVLVMLIIIALLVNFSFFLTGLVIDASNIVALLIYNTITDNQREGAEIGKTLVMNMQLSTLKAPGPEGQTNIDPYDLALAHLMGAVFLFIAAFVFFAGAILFILRTIVLMFLLVLAPIAFVAAILPKTQHHWNDWFGKLINHSFVAPVYLLLMSIVLLITKDGALLSATEATGKNLASALLFLNNRASFANETSIVLNYVLLIGLVLAVYIITNKMTNGISRLSVRWAGAGVGLVAGGAGLAYRQTAGRGLYATSEYLKRSAEKEGSGVHRWLTGNVGQRYAARMAMRTSDFGAKASGDIRADTRFGKVTRGVTGLTAAGAALGGAGAQVDAGRAAGKGGRAAAEKAKEERQARFMGTLGTEEAQRSYAQGIERRTPIGAYRYLRAREEEAGTAVQTAKKNLEIAQEKMKQVKQRDRQITPSSDPHNVESVRKDLETAKTELKQAQKHFVEATATEGKYTAAERERVEERMTRSGALRERGARIAETRQVLTELGYESKDAASPKKEPSQNSDAV